MLHRRRRIACALASPRPTNTRKSTRATLVSRIAARCPNAKLRIAPAVYAPMPLNERSVSSSDGNSPPYRATDSRAIACRRRGRMLYPSGRQVSATSSSGAAASASSEGYLSSHSWYFGSDAIDLRLLEHHLRNEYVIRIVGVPPRKVTPVLAVPGEKRAAEPLASCGSGQGGD